MSERPLTPKQVEILGEVFNAEIDNALSRKSATHICQLTKAKADPLVKRGLITPAETVLGGRFPVTIRGYELTHLGRMTYGQHCADEPDEEEEDTP